MDKTSKVCQVFSILIILLATLFHGGFFAVEYILLTISILAFLVFGKNFRVSKTSLFLLLGIIVLYYLSSMFSGYNTGMAITESTKPLLLLAAIILGSGIKKISFMKSLVIASVTLGVIGLFSLCKIIEFNDFVYVYNGVRSLQSTMQYANSAAVVLICGIYATRALRKKDGNCFLCSVIEIILTVCLLFTHSKIAIAVYITTTVVELLLLKDGIPLNLIIHSLSAVLIYVVMDLLIKAKYSFVALIFCIIVVLFMAEKITTIKKSSVKISRFGAAFLIVGTVFALIAVLFFVDISTLVVRFLYYADGAKALIQSPLLGLSPGGWSEYQYNFQSAQYFVSQIHSGILQFGVDSGVFAMLLFFALLTLALIGLIKLWNKDKNTNDLYILLIFIALIGHGSFDFDFSYGCILIILGICISYGFADAYPVKLKVPHKSVAVLCVAFLVYVGLFESSLYFAKTEYNKLNYQKASNCYEFISKIYPYDTDSYAMWGVCQGKLGNQELAEKIISQAYQRCPDNRDIILKAMDMAANNENFPLYITYQNQLLKCAPMQQDSYNNSINYLNHFHQNNLIDESVYLNEKNKLITIANETNKNMSSLNQFLQYGAEIDLSIIK